MILDYIIDYFINGMQIIVNAIIWIAKASIIVAIVAVIAVIINAVLKK